MSRSKGEDVDYTEATRLAARELLDDPNTPNFLSDREIELASFVLDNLIIPDIEYGIAQYGLRKGVRYARVTIPDEEANQDRFPIVTMRSDEDMVLDGVTPAPLQVYVMEKFFGKLYGEASSKRMARDAAAVLAANSPTAMTWPEESSAAAVQASLEIFSFHVDGVENKARIFNRPVAVIRHDPGKEQLSDVGGLVMAAMGIGQTIGRSAEIPVWEPYVEEIPNALQANSVSARLLEANYHRDTVRHALNDQDSKETHRARIEQIRAHHNDPEDPYKMSSALQTILLSQDLTDELWATVEVRASIYHQLVHPGHRNRNI